MNIAVFKRMHELYFPRTHTEVWIQCKTRRNVCGLSVYQHLETERWIKSLLHSLLINQSILSINFNSFKNVKNTQRNVFKLLVLSGQQQPKMILFTTTSNRQKQQILTFNKLLSEFIYFFPLHKLLKCFVDY